MHVNVGLNAMQSSGYIVNMANRCVNSSLSGPSVVRLIGNFLTCHTCIFN